MADRSSDRELFEELKNLIDDDKKPRELECREYLKYANDLLYRNREHVDKYFSEVDYRLHCGDSDYVVAANEIDEGGKMVNRAFLWELKAPQCPIFVTENKNSLRPSKYFYKVI